MAEQSLDADYLARWVGQGETVRDVITAGQAQRLAATLGLQDLALENDDALPHFWHWIYFLPATPAADLAADGLPGPDDFMPPVALPRRMFAGGRIEAIKPIRLGETVERQSTVKDITVKSGRSGHLCFVVVRHEFLVDGELRTAEEHDAVYREEADPDAPVSQPPLAPTAADWSQTIEPDPVMLFRYSALTFNGHRIHYDRRYCLEEEGYEGLVVHGPLTGTWLLDQLRQRLPNAVMEKFSFRAVSPLFDTHPLTVSGRVQGNQVELWAANHLGQLAMQGTATIA